MEVLSTLGQAFIVGLILASIYMAGAFVIRSKGEDFADFFKKKISSGFYLFIGGFWLDLVAYLTFA